MVEHTNLMDFNLSIADSESNTDKSIDFVVVWCTTSIELVIRNASERNENIKINRRMSLENHYIC